MAMTDLANIIHDSLCGEAAIKCQRYTEGNPHYHYYQAQANILMVKLGSIIGAANVCHVVGIVLDELI